MVFVCTSSVYWILLRRVLHVCDDGLAGRTVPYCPRRGVLPERLRINAVTLIRIIVGLKSASLPPRHRQWSEHRLPDNLDTLDVARSPALAPAFAPSWSCCEQSNAGSERDEIATRHIPPAKEMRAQRLVAQRNAASCRTIYVPVRAAVKCLGQAGYHLGGTQEYMFGHCGLKWCPFGLSLRGAEISES